MEQLAIAVTGCVAIWLVNDQREARRKWASVFGLAGQPFWIYSAYVAEQWGILVLTFVYTASWARGFYNSWIAEQDMVEVEAKVDWIDWSMVGWPDWGDEGKRVEIECDDGTTVVGKLDVDDFFPDGEGGEVPVFVVIADDGIKHSFANNNRWRFVPPN